MMSASIDPKDNKNNDGVRETVSLLLMCIGTILITLYASPMLALGILLLVMSVIIDPGNTHKKTYEHEKEE